MKIATRFTNTLPLAAAVGALLLTVASIVVTGRLRHGVDESRIAQIRLETLDARVNAVSAREWQLIAERRFSPSVAGELEEALDQAARWRLSYRPGSRRSRRSRCCSASTAAPWMPRSSW